MEVKQEAKPKGTLMYCTSQATRKNPVETGERPLPLSCTLENEGLSPRRLPATATRRGPAASTPSRRPGSNAPHPRHPGETPLNPTLHVRT